MSLTNNFRILSLSLITVASNQRFLNTQQTLIMGIDPMVLQMGFRYPSHACSVSLLSRFLSRARRFRGPIPSMQVDKHSCLCPNTTSAKFARSNTRVGIVFFVCLILRNMCVYMSYIYIISIIILICQSGPDPCTPHRVQAPSWGVLLY